MHKSFGGLLIAAICLLVAYAFAHRPPAVLPPNAQTMDKALVLAVHTGERQWVAVGDGGWVYRSENRGGVWTAIKTPTQATLTSVHFVDENSGFAAGHDAVVLKTEDGGLHWAVVHNEPEWETPILNIWLAQDGRIGYAVGAYGLLLRTQDGGMQWTRQSISEDDKHLNALIGMSKGQLLVVGEAGTVWTSADQGNSWDRVASDYKGSYFGAVALDDRTALIFGMRGHMAKVDLSTRTLQALSPQSNASLFASHRPDAQRLWVAGQDGAVWLSEDHGRSFTSLKSTALGVVTAIRQVSATELITWGDKGMRTVEFASGKVQ